MRIRDVVPPRVWACGSVVTMTHAEVPSAYPPPADFVAKHIGVKDRTFTASGGIAGSGTVGGPGRARLAIESGETAGA